MIILASITDMIKNKFLEEFTGEFSATGIIVSLFLAFILGLIILAVYKITYTGVFFNKSYGLGLVLSTMITAVIIAAVNSNLSLSLGMVGALSIVRFRTAIKDPNDTIFMFWTVAVGIMAGAGFYYMSVLATLILAALYVILFYCGVKIGSEAALLVVRCQPGAISGLKSELSAFGSRKEKSRTSNENYTEIIYQIKRTKKSAEAVETLREAKGVISVTMVSYKGEFAQ